jgi:hypothetical protein
MADSVINAGVFARFIRLERLTGNDHSACHYSYNAPYVQSRATTILETQYHTL